MTTTAPLATTASRTPAEDSKSVPKGARADIQALRAVAVGLVVIYHFWPQRLTGGYVGVDVFFVISGFLITTHLLEKPPTHARDLAEFWGRRIRRLLPAAFVVILATLVATWLIAPETIWHNTAVQGLASATYVQNWVLAREAVDYLSADNVATAVQHYWSLSIEEQFYLVWPVLILAVTWSAGRLGVSRRLGVAVAVSTVFVGSLAISVLVTAHDPAAYFLSHARFWELAAGGLIALVAPLLVGIAAAPARAALGWGGLALIAWAALTFDAATVFPGSAALLPVAGTALVILADVRPGAGSPLWLMRRRIVQVAGDASYSVYLWHWPFVVLLPYALGRPAGWPEKLAAVAVVVVLSLLTKSHVEERFRGRAPLGAPLRRSFVFAVVGAVLTALLSGGLVMRTHVLASTDRVSAAWGERCFGSAALTQAGCDPHGDQLLQSALAAKEDLPKTYDDGCLTQKDDPSWKTCEYGSTAADAPRVLLLGNSHASHWLPALDEIAKSKGWHITTKLMFECYTVDRPIVLDGDGSTENCLRWNKAMIEEVAAAEYDLVVVSNRTLPPLVGADSARESRRQTVEAGVRIVKQWEKAGQPVLILRDPPEPPTENTPDCVAAHLDDLSACDGSVAQTRTPDPLAKAALDVAAPKVDVLDLSKHFCDRGRCYATIGGLVAYYDRSHLTATFARTLAAPIEEAASELMAE